MLLNVVTAPSGGGAEALVFELGKRLSDQGVKNEVYYFNLGRNKKLLYDNEFSFDLSSRNPLAILRLRRLFKLKLKTVPSLLIHAHLTWPFYYVAIASFGLKNISLVYTEHNTSNKRRYFPAFKYFERLVYSRYKKIICISQGVRDSLSYWIGGRLSQKIIVINNGSKIYNFSERDPVEDRDFRLISVGSLTFKKNFSTAIFAISLIANKIDSYTIVGDGPERKFLEGLIQRLSLENKVKIIGWSNNVEYYLKESDIQLIPSLWEGFGLVAVEGMSTGLPVVSSDVDGLREVLGKGNLSSFLVGNLKDEKEWRDKILMCIESLKKNPKVLQRAAREQSLQFSLDKMVKKYIKIYREFGLGECFDSVENVYKSRSK